MLPGALQAARSLSATRVLDGPDLADTLEVLRRDPVANAFVATRVEAVGLDPWRLGGEMWGWFDQDGRLESLCYAGANLVPINAGPQAVRAFAERARRQGRRCSSIVGPAEQTAALWALLEPSWGPAVRCGPTSRCWPPPSRPPRSRPTRWCAGSARTSSTC